MMHIKIEIWENFGTILGVQEEVVIWWHLSILMFFIKTSMVFFNECDKGVEGCVQGVDGDGIVQRL